MFCSPFDDALAHTGPAAIFRLDREGLLRFEPEWTRDAWGRAPGPHPHGWTWTLARDRASGFVQLLLVTSGSLLRSHPRLELRRFASEADARAALDTIGRPPIDAEPWA